MDKMAAFRKSSDAPWTQEAVGEGFFVWRLPSDWLQFYFQGAYRTILRDTDPATSEMNFRSAVFERPNGDKEIWVHSFRSQPPATYDFEWTVFDLYDEDPKAIVRISDAGKFAAQLSAVQANPLVLRIQSTDIDEVIDLNLQTLSTFLHQSEADRQALLMPFRRLLIRLWMLKWGDPPAFAKVPLPIQDFLANPARPSSDFLTPSGLPLRSFMKPPAPTPEAAMATETPLIVLDRATKGITWALVQEWQQQKLLPTELSWLGQVSVPLLREKMHRLQRIANDPHLQPGPNVHPDFVPKIPAVLRQLDADKIDIVELQVLMTIGALREVWGFRERAVHELKQKKPQLKALGETPEALAILQQDEDFRIICSNPQALKQQQEDLEADQHLKGDHGPTPFEKQRAASLAGHTFMMEKIAEAQQATAAFTPFFASMGIPAMPPLPTPPVIDLYPEDDVPAWRVYKPYCI